MHFSAPPHATMPASPKVRAYLAVSADGFVADSSGGVGFLDDYHGQDLGYDAFIATVDALVMGRRTYDQVRGFGPWPYAERPAWIITSRPLESPPPAARAAAPDPGAVLAQAAAAGCRSVWLVGGPAAIALFDQADLIDTWELTIVPQRLGAGLPLFTTPRPARLKLERAADHPCGVVQLDYAVQRTHGN